MSISIGAKIDVVIDDLHARSMVGDRMLDLILINYKIVRATPLSSYGAKFWFGGLPIKGTS